MGFEFFIASRLKLGANNRKGSPSLNVALAGIVLAIVVMILSVVIVRGFKNEITSKINNLDSHLKISNGAIGLDENFDVVDFREITRAIMGDDNLKREISSFSLIAVKPAILKTDNDFLGIQFKGVDANYDFSFLRQHLVEGRTPSYENSDSTQEIMISSSVANSLGLRLNDKIMTYFIDEKVKVRNCQIVGIFNTDFEVHDKAYIIGNIALIQSVNGWKPHQGNFAGVTVNDLDLVEPTSYELYGKLAAQSVGDNDTNMMYNVTNIRQNNMSYYTWLGMLDMNVIIILALMVIVSAFTLISALLMVILERIRMVGLLKALGAGNTSIRRIFIYLTQKIIIKAMILGNVIGIGLALLQQHFHIVKLDPEAYYMSYVPVHIDVPSLIILNTAIFVISIITLVAPSYIISTIRPTATMRFE